MDHFIKVGTFAAALAFGVAVQAAPHSATYTQVSVAPGTIVSIGGKQYVAVQVPMRQFTQDKRYAVRFLTPLHTDETGNSVFAELTTRHAPDSLTDANATIDTFPAKLEVSDGRSYSVQTTFSTQTFTPTNQLKVDGDVTASVTIQVGDTLVLLFNPMFQTDQDVELGPNEYRGTGKAVYGKYTDPALLVAAQDKWVDYIRVIPLN